VVPCVDDATTHMFPLRGRLVAARGLLDVDGKLLVGPVCARSVSTSLLPSTWSFGGGGTTDLVCSRPRTAAILTRSAATSAGCAGAEREGWLLLLEMLVD